MNHDDHKRATTPPEHLVALVAKHVPAPDPYRSPWPPEKVAEMHRARCVEIATLIWAEAYHTGSMAGSARTLATMSVRYMIVTPEEKARIVERIETEAEGAPS